jgi:hypothetical protein
MSLNRKHGTRKIPCVKKSDSQGMEKLAGAPQNPLSSRDLLVIVALNLLPIAGVLLWDWRSFDLIFLYWMENLIIGGFCALRMIARPYRHPIDLVFPLFLVPFFVLHYGAFCWGHGQFVVSMFADDAGGAHLELFDAVTAALQQTPMLMAVLALVLLQAIDWIRDSHQHGLGADGVKELMVAPYRRIVVLHLTIIFGGFIIMALGEPTTGLLMLIAIKTASDFWHWRLDATRGHDEEPLELSQEQLQEMQQLYAEPKVTVNGKDRHFDSFAALKKSREFRMMQSIMRLMGARDQLRVINSFMDSKIAEERCAD